MNKDEMLRRLYMLDEALAKTGKDTTWFIAIKGWPRRYGNDRAVVFEIIEYVENDKPKWNLREYLRDCNYVWKKLHELR